MRARVLMIGLLLAGFVDIGAAQHVVPTRALRFRGSLVPAYDRCQESGNPVTNYVCEPRRKDDLCTFDPDGWGEYRVAMRRSLPLGGGMSIHVRLAGLSAGCEGSMLLFEFDMWGITRTCADGRDCTWRDGINPVAECTVVDGKCAMDANFGGPPVNFGAGTVLPVDRIRVRRDYGPETFVAGIAAP